jgi:hypothetical protein
MTSSRKSSKNGTPGGRRLAIGASVAAIALAGGAYLSGVLPVGASPLIAASPSGGPDDPATSTVTAVAGSGWSDTSVTSPTVPATTDAAVPSGSVSTHDAADAGTVTVEVDGLRVVVVAADPADGWSAEIETDEPHEAEVNFRRGGERVDFRAEIEDGRLKVRIRDRRGDAALTTPSEDDGRDRSGRDHPEDD